MNSDQLEGKWKQVKGKFKEEYGDVTEDDTKHAEGKFDQMLGKLQETIGGGKGIQAAGGFAGSGQQQQYVQSAKDVYGKGMSDVLAQTGQQRLAGLQNVQNIMNQWRDTALRIKGTI